jgi:predicted nucleic acid-binding protein
VKYLLDVNVLLALAHQDHADHGKVSTWFQSVHRSATEVQTCAITELDFVRISVQAGLTKDIATALNTLAGLKQSSRVPFVIVPDALGVANLPKQIKKPAQLTDGHLLKLAESSGAKLVTLDKGIPGAVLIN